MEKRSGAASATAIGLTSVDIARITGLYDQRLAEHGLDVRTVGWGTKSEQEMRFDVLCRGLDLRGKRVLDLGCGLGDFVSYAEAKYGGDFNYCGMDISEKLITAARQRFDGPKRDFIVGTLTPHSDIGEFDVTLLSGTLTFKVTDNIATMKNILTSAWSRSTEAVCCNFMTAYADFTLDKNFHYSPEEVFALSKTLTRFVSLYHDYDLWEFTIQLHRKPALKRAKNI